MMKYLSMLLVVVVLVIQGVGSIAHARPPVPEGYRWMCRLTVKEEGKQFRYTGLGQTSEEAEAHALDRCTEDGTDWTVCENGGMACWKRAENE